MIIHNFKNIITVGLAALLTQMFSAHAIADEIVEGQFAPDFSIIRMDGEQFNLSDFRGKKAVYLVFWTTWCTYCMKKIPKLQHAATILDDQIEILAIDTSVKDTFAKAQQFQKDRNIKYSLAFDFGKKVTDLYDVWGTPTEFIIDINGRIIHIDGVPENLSEHLSNWNMIDHGMKKQQLIAHNNCNSENNTC
ncbi:MAG: redoxin domain-containing protein [Kangiellaceae bacterium]|nr:redoxin domain-containing protein [Kangiellaceae bacterium]